MWRLPGAWSVEVWHFCNTGQHMCRALWDFVCVCVCVENPVAAFTWGELDFWQRSEAWRLFSFLPCVPRCHCVCSAQVLQELFSRSPLRAGSLSFWMNDLRSKLPGSLHQTWPTLIINDSGGQCPIFTAESSVMPGQTKPPEFHHFQRLLTPSTKENLHLLTNGWGIRWKPALMFLLNQTHFALWGPPRVGSMMQRYLPLFVLYEEPLLSPPGQRPITPVLHSISCVKCLINPLIILGGVSRRTLDAQCQFAG